MTSLASCLHSARSVLITSVCGRHVDPSCRIKNETTLVWRHVNLPKLLVVTEVVTDVVPVDVAEMLMEELPVDEADDVGETLTVLDPELVAELVAVLD